MKSIVLIEDTPTNRQVIADLFQYDGIDAQLHAFASAEQALDAIPSIQPVLVLMDIALPGMTGLEAAQRLKRQPQTRDIPIWAVTAHALKGDRDEALRAGCCEYFSKPLCMRYLGDRLRRFLNELDQKEAA